MMINLTFTFGCPETPAAVKPVTAADAKAAALAGGPVYLSEVNAAAANGHGLFPEPGADQTPKFSDYWKKRNHNDS